MKMIMWTARLFQKRQKVLYCMFSHVLEGVMCIGRRAGGLYFGPKTIFIPPSPPKKDIFPPLATCLFSTSVSYHALFALILSYFA
jgi:hypothetical protein